MVRTRLTSSGLNTGGSFLRLLEMPDLGRQIVVTQRDAEQEAHSGHDPVAVADAGAALDEMRLESTHLVGHRCIGRTFEPGGEPLAAIVDMAALMCELSLRAAMSSIIR